MKRKKTSLILVCLAIWNLVCLPHAKAQELQPNVEFNFSRSGPCVILEDQERQIYSETKQMCQNVLGGYNAHFQMGMFRNFSKGIWTGLKGTLNPGVLHDDSGVQCFVTSIPYWKAMSECLSGKPHGAEWAYAMTSDLLGANSDGRIVGFVSGNIALWKLSSMVLKDLGLSLKSFTVIKTILKAHPDVFVWAPRVLMATQAVVLSTFAYKDIRSYYLWHRAIQEAENHPVDFMMAPIEHVGELHDQAQKIAYQIYSDLQQKYAHTSDPKEKRELKEQILFYQHSFEVENRARAIENQLEEKLKEYNATSDEHRQDELDIEIKHLQQQLRKVR